MSSWLNFVFLLDDMYHNVHIVSSYPYSSSIKKNNKNYSKIFIWRGEGNFDNALMTKMNVLWHIEIKVMMKYNKKRVSKVTLNTVYL